jgi:hypothetical protein
MKMPSLIALAAFFALAFCGSPLRAAEDGAVIDGQFPVVSNLRAGVAKVDITPSDVVGFTVAGHTRQVTGVRDPLRAGVLILDDGDTKAAIVTLDTVTAWDGMVKLARQSIEKETGVPAANIMVAASHNHSGPGYVENVRWGGELITKLGAAAKLRRGSHRLQHQSPQDHRWPCGGALESRWPERSAREGAALR